MKTLCDFWLIWSRYVLEIFKLNLHSKQNVLSLSLFCEDVCQQPIEVGPCDAIFPRWAYDPDLGCCVPFQYGGCGGNRNNFETQEACERRCESQSQGNSALFYFFIFFHL